eukprot:403057-Ditylum_brightwellii.AAC.1
MPSDYLMALFICEKLRGEYWIQWWVDWWDKAMAHLMGVVPGAHDALIHGVSWDLGDHGNWEAYVSHKLINNDLSRFMGSGLPIPFWGPGSVWPGIRLSNWVMTGLGLSP